MIFNKLIPLLLASTFSIATADGLTATRLDASELDSEKRSVVHGNVRRLGGSRAQGDQKRGREQTNQARDGPGQRALPPIVQPTGVDFGFIEENRDDMGLRFSKNPTIESRYWEGGNPDYMTLGAGDFPITHETAKALRSKTGAISVYQKDDCDECALDMDGLIKSTKVAITYPSKDPESAYWHELSEVIVMQIHRNNNEDVEKYLKLPQIWGGYNIEDVAQAVHDEYPGIHHVNLISGLFGGALDRTFTNNCEDCVSVDRDIIPIQSSAAFIRGIVMLADMCTWMIRAVGPQNFQTKWHVGRPRPEEVVWKIYNNDLTAADGVPQYIIDMVKDNFELDRMQDFTAYATGSPEHPSFPAMHSAASASSMWLALVLNLTDEQLCEIRAVDYAVAYARTIAGVHYYTDNIAGLNLGQEILASKLPQYLADMYGSDPKKVEEKIKRVRLDWNDYLTSECVVNSL